MNRSEKEQLVSQMREKLVNAKCVVVAHQTGLTVSEVSALRRDMRGAGTEFKVLKNTLAKIAVQGTPLEGLSTILEGPTALAFSCQDAIAPAKVAAKFASKNDRLKLVGGYLDGQILDAKGVDALAKLPSLDELRSKILAVINTPATRIALLAKEPATRVARVLNAYGSGQ
ncbi:50S ribosomal protein L10 [Candidatus Odyssella acanthamoebae]|uniref:Large ribosomal subunit protein uL10 n=1 Tax=Candidatus Odyssella acanthamoebae TaxID=91604 RepID=A0A077AWF5_9PROT|nr:50S ribosomal protein L10 [Candidatus Paracaedibacter acanthamoebae]AIK96776.1 50S ribosomal protein L10 [Candidatus Paracaedibacter acanthamoebae]